MMRTKVSVSPYAAAVLLAFLIGCGGAGVTQRERSACFIRCEKSRLEEANVRKKKRSTQTAPRDQAQLRFAYLSTSFLVP